MPNYNFNMFQRNAKKNVQKSFKDLSHEWKHDFSLANLIPCLGIPTLPGDEFNIRSQFYFLFDPLYYPIIHHLGLDVDYFWVRNSNMWPKYLGEEGLTDGWENFITLKEDLLHPTVDVDMSTVNSPSSTNESIYGYLGVPYILYDEPTRQSTLPGLNALPAMAYLMIYDQYYSHPQLEEPRVKYPLIGGDNTFNLYEEFGFFTPSSSRLNVFPAKWQKDYFTSCLPTPQVGDPVQIPVIGEDKARPSTWRDVNGNLIGAGDLVTNVGGVTEVGGTPVGLDIQPQAGTIRELGMLAIMQTFKEQLMRWGQRYRDWISGAFNEDIDPLQLDIPIMIGSFRGKVEISTTLTQANTLIAEAEFNTGDYTGNASLFEQGNVVEYKCHDYGYLMCIFTLVPNTSYGQGVPRYMRYTTPFDYPMDIFCGVGDQEILKEEVFYTNLVTDSAKNRETFGYGVRYQEAFTIPNNYGSNLQFGTYLSTHMGRFWDPLTVTGATYDDVIEIQRDFVAAWENVGRGGVRTRDVFKTLTFPTGGVSINPIVGYVYHQIGALRPLPAFSTPSLGGL